MIALTTAFERVLMGGHNQLEHDAAAAAELVATELNKLFSAPSGLWSSADPPPSAVRVSATEVSITWNEFTRTLVARWHPTEPQTGQWWGLDALNFAGEVAKELAEWLQP